MSDHGTTRAERARGAIATPSATATAGAIATAGALTALLAGCDGQVVSREDGERADEREAMVVPESFASPRDGVVVRVAQLRPFEQADLCEHALTCDPDALVIALVPSGAGCDGWYQIFLDHEPTRVRMIALPSGLQAPGTYALSEPWPIAAIAESALDPSQTAPARLDVVAMDASRLVVRTAGLTSIPDGERTVLRCDTPTSRDGVARPSAEDPGALAITLIGGGAGNCSDPEGVCDQGADVLEVVLGPEQLAGGPLRVGDLGPKGCAPESPIDRDATLEVVAVDRQEVVLVLAHRAGGIPTARELVIPICP